MLTLEIDPTILAFEDLTTELEGANLQEKLTKYHTTDKCTYMGGVVERFMNYLIDVSIGQKICVLFITDGHVQDLTKITPFLLTCVDIITEKKLSVYMSCVAINSSADMKAFSLFGFFHFPTCPIEKRRQLGRTGDRNLRHPRLQLGGFTRFEDEVYVF